jgi:cyclopropane fatty-acyl-phospholipid synthase-like methyltransferase
VSGAPERITHAVELLDVQPDDRLLELGCGGGVAVPLVCERLDGGTIAAVDRSEVQVERALRRNAAEVDSGKAVIRVAEIADVDGGPFDKVFAVNVNVFWTEPATRELAAIRAVLAPGGRLYLFYDPPSPTKRRSLEEKLVATLAAGGFEPVLVDSPYVAVISAPKR